MTGRSAFLCDLCGSSRPPAPILDLGDQPICNAFLTKGSLTKPETRFPLKMVRCRSCNLVQLSEKAPRKVVFGARYNYLSGTTAVLVRFFDSVADLVVRELQLSDKALVCDIGSNDGSLLKSFKARGCRVIGVEPTPKPARKARASGIPTVQDYFTLESARRVKSEVGQADVVTAFNVLAHTDQLRSMMSGVVDLMKEGSFFVSQSHYLPSLIEKLEYDTIYHEHLRYYTLASLRKLHELYGLHVFDAQTNDIYGGSVLVFASKKPRPPSPSMEKISRREAAYESSEVYARFRHDAETNARKLRSMLVDLKRKGASIAGVGAPMKSSTLLNFSRIGPEILDYLAEVNPLKIGTYSPGVHIPVVDEKRFFDSPPDYALILSWNVADDIMAKMRGAGFDGKFIIPIPKPSIV